MKAIVVGATGLVGSHLLNQLIESDQFESIIAPVRRPLNIINPTLRAPVVDFKKLEQYPELFNADILFFC
ncbi:MAG: hypothetical protein JNM93_09550, partial [Bacteriovoracaceae bacterium]|nr:hypothetical protein [Bacteriovoracaceae bacterium]